MLPGINPCDNGASAAITAATTATATTEAVGCGEQRKGRTLRDVCFPLLRRVP